MTLDVFLLGMHGSDAGRKKKVKEVVEEVVVPAHMQMYNDVLEKYKTLPIAEHVPLPYLAAGVLVVIILLFFTVRLNV